MRSMAARVRVSRRVRRVAVGGALLVVALVCIGAVGVGVLVREAPVWWRTVKRGDPRVMELARRVENGLLKGVSEHKPGSPEDQAWVIRLGAAEANAWLNARLPMWLANRESEEFAWPREFSELQVNFDERRIRVGVRVHARSGDKFLSATLAPALRADGSLWLPARWVHMGRLGVPASWVLDGVLGGVLADEPGYIPEHIMALPETAAMLRAFAGEQPIVYNAVVRLQDGRRLRVLKLSCEDGVLEVLCRTERPEELARAGG